MSEKALPTNADLAHQFELIGELLEISGGQSRHRILAYVRGAARIRAAGESVAAMALQGRATELPDIGKTLQDKTVELVNTGRIAALERLRGEIPEGVAHIARLSGIGPKRAKLIWETLDVRDLDTLRAAVASGQLAEVPGIGPKLVADVTRELDDLLRSGSTGRDRFAIGRALPVAEQLVADLGRHPSVVAISVAGGLRRGSEWVHDIDCAVATTDSVATEKAIVDHPMVTSRVSGASAGVAVMTQAGIRAEFRFTGPATFGNLLQHLTGSRAHNIRLRELAVRQGLSISEHGIATQDGPVITAADETAVYGALGLTFIPPELREDTGELEVAATGLLPELVSELDLRGELHSHSTWSDGRDTIEAMVEAALAIGHEYLAVSDHSKALAMAGGLDADRVRRQWDEIDDLAVRVPGIRVLKSCEVDVLADGHLDHDDELLAGFDWVTASLHSGFTQSSAKLTHRLLAAIESPWVDVIGHPTGRMRDKREGYAFDVDSVFGRAAETGTALEINAQPRRLDLSADLARRALAAGARLTIGTDAHDAGELGLRRFGVLVARRAGATPERVLNTFGWNDLSAMRDVRKATHPPGSTPLA